MSYIILAFTYLCLLKCETIPNIQYSSLIRGPFGDTLFIFILINLYLKLTKTSRMHIAGNLHENIATQNIINEC